MSGLHRPLDLGERGKYEAVAGRPLGHSSTIVYPCVQTTTQPFHSSSPSADQEAPAEPREAADERVHGVEPDAETEDHCRKPGLP